MKETLFGQLCVIGMRGCESFVKQVDKYLKEWRPDCEGATFLVEADLVRFGTGEGKGVLHTSMRGHDVFIFCDMFNYGETYKLYGMEKPMSPDEHYADLKRVIGAIGGKARRISVIMPMLYEGRQDKRASRESLDCAIALKELVSMGVTNIITFDAHNASVQNAIPLSSFDDVHPTYQMLKALVRAVPDISLEKEDLVIISPDAGGMQRCMYYSSLLGLDIGMFYKRRNYSLVVDGRNPIVAHEYLGTDVAGKDVIIIDDMIASGESILEVAYKLKEKGAKRIFASASFGLFTSGLDRFDKAYADGYLNKVFTTNLIYRNPGLASKDWYVEVNMCKYVAYIIDTLNHDDTISGLLNPVQRINNLIAKHRQELGGQIKLDI